MNWALILSLSLFGAAMGLGTVFFIPSSVEPMLWLPIFAICAYLIARGCEGRHFLQGLVLGLANSFWITAFHMTFLGHYFATHAAEAEMMKSMPAPDSPRLMMALVGPVIGLVSGAVIGGMAVVAGKLVKRSPGAP